MLWGRSCTGIWKKTERPAADAIELPDFLHYVYPLTIQSPRQVTIQLFPPIRFGPHEQEYEGRARGLGGITC